MIRKLALSVALATCASSVWALGLGEIKLTSGLNQPLVAEIPLLSADDVDLDKLITVLASKNDFDRVGVERSYFLTKIKFEAKKKANGKKYIQVSTRESVKDPFVNFLLEINWPQGRLLKEYTLLLDPPVYSQQIKKSPIKVVEKKTSFANPPEPEKKKPSTSNATKVTPAKPAASFVSNSDRTYGPTRSTDTLWGVAKKFSAGSNVSLHSLMVAIYRANPHAFINNNMNNLKKGQMLTIPTDQEVAELDGNSALSTIAKHNKNWSPSEGQSAGLRPNASSESTNDESKGAASTGKSLPVESSNDAKAGRLKLVTPSEDATKLLSSGSSNNSSEALEIGEYSEGKQVQAEAVQAIAELKDENGKLRDKNEDLQRQIDELNNKLDSLLKIQNVDLAKLELSAAKANESAQQPANSETALESGVDVTTSPESALNSTETTSTIITPTSTETSEPELTTDGSEASVEPASTELVDTQDATNAEPAAVDAVKPEGVTSSAPVVVEKEQDILAIINNLIKEQPMLPYYIGGGVALLLILLLLLLRKKRDEESYYEEPMADEHKVVLGGDDKLMAANLDEQIESLAPEMPILSNNAYDQAKTADTVTVSTSDDSSADPLAEADIYIAYGRYNQAENLLKEAFDYEPERLDIAVKLLECYSQSNNQKAFEKLAATIYPKIGADTALKAEVNALYSSAWPDSVLDDYEEAASVKNGADYNGLSPEFAALAGEDFMESLNAKTSAKNEPETSKSVDVAPLEFDLSVEDEDKTFGPKEKVTVLDDAPSLDFGSDNDLDFFSGTDEASTKLDLARAYIDMGDLDGAKEILLEVSQEGNAQQQKDAKALLDKM